MVIEAPPKHAGTGWPQRSQPTRPHNAALCPKNRGQYRGFCTAAIANWACRESLLLSAFYGALGLGLGGFVSSQLGQQATVEYLTGFVVEKSLALDNGPQRRITTCSAALATWCKTSLRTGVASGECSC